MPMSARRGPSSSYAASMQLVLRPACAADDPALAEIDYRCWSELTDPGLHWASDRPFFGPPTGTAVADVLVAVDADDPATPLGFIKLSPTASCHGDWYIGGLGVAPAARRQGIARALIEAAVAKAALRGGNRVWLKVLSTNAPAISLYADLGFSVVERTRRPFQDRPDADDLRLARRAAVN